jgi:FkbM family methyltransferase
VKVSWREFVYSRYRNPGFSSYLRKSLLAPSILIEAGCHYGEDTKLLVEKLELEHTFAFEPDPDAFAKAKEVLTGLPNIELFPYGLGETQGSFSLFVNRSEPENGTSGLEFNVENSEEWTTTQIEVKTLDSVISGSEVFTSVHDRKCFLWLDVEGFEHQVLKGSSLTIGKVGVAQIEINMHNALRKANYLQVLSYMYKQGFGLIYAPLHPGYFGDSVFLHHSVMSSRNTKVRGILLGIAMVFLHSVVYPLLRKPGKPNKPLQAGPSRN